MTQGPIGTTTSCRALDLACSHAQVESSIAPHDFEPDRGGPMTALPFSEATPGRTSGDDGHTTSPEVGNELGKRARVVV